MANRFPLIFNSGAGQIQELAASDNLDLTSSNLVNAGILSTSSGSVTAPSLQIGSGTTYNPGLYSPGTDQLAVATNGTGRVFVNASGNVGVGTSAPGQLLEIKGANARFAVNSTTVADGGILLQGNGTTYAEIKLDASSGILDIAEKQAAGNITFSTGTTPTERLRVTSAGLVGIGTGSPAAQFQVNAASDVTIALSNSSSVTSGNRGTISMYNSAVSSVGTIRFAAVTDNVGTEIQFFTRPAAGSHTQTMTLDSSGRLLVGTVTGNANGGILQLTSGITFPATAVAASDANTLDDYEEGTWTIGLERPEEDLIAFEDLTEELVVSWVLDKLGEEQVVNMETSLTNQIQEQKTPSKIQGLPWA